MKVEPQSVRAGHAVTVSYEPDETHGIAVELMRRQGGKWELAYQVIPGMGAADAEIHRAGETVPVIMVAHSGGSYDVPIPADLPPGQYRVGDARLYAELAVVNSEPA